MLASWGCHTKCHRLGDLNSRYVFSHSPGGWTSKIKVWAGWFLLRPLSWACRGPSSPCVLTCHPSVHICVLVSCSSKDTSQIGSRPVLKTLFKPNCILKCPIPPNTITFWGTGVLTSTYEFWRGAIQFIMRPLPGCWRHCSGCGPLRGAGQNSRGWEEGACLENKRGAVSG